jgi:hypothetical protein
MVFFPALGAMGAMGASGTTAAGAAGLGAGLGSLFSGLFGGGDEKVGGYEMAPWWYSLPSLVLGLLDIGRSEEENLKAENFLNEMMGYVQRGISDIDTAGRRYQPSFLYQGQIYGPAANYPDIVSQTPVGFDKASPAYKSIIGAEETIEPTGPVAGQRVGGSVTNLATNEALPGSGVGLDSRGATARSYGGSTYNPVPAVGPIIDINDLSGGASDALDVFRSGLKDPGAWGLEGWTIPEIDTSQLSWSRKKAFDVLSLAEEKALGALEAGKVDDILAGIEMPDTDLSDVLKANLSGIGQASKAREQQTQQALAAALGPAMGGLENIQGQQMAASLSEASNRSALGLQARADVRARELAAQEFVSGLQSEAAMREAELNNLLTQQAGGIISGLGTAKGGMLTDFASLFERAAETNADIGATNIGNVLGILGTLSGLTGAEGEADYRALMDTIGLFTGLSEDELLRAISKSDAQRELFNALAGTGEFQRNYIPRREMMDNLVWPKEQTV